MLNFLLGTVIVLILVYYLLVLYVPTSIEGIYTIKINVTKINSKTGVKEEEVREKSSKVAIVKIDTGRYCLLMVSDDLKILKPSTAQLVMLYPFMACVETTLRTKSAGAEKLKGCLKVIPFYMLSCTASVEKDEAFIVATCKLVRNQSLSEEDRKLLLPALPKPYENAGDSEQTVSELFED